MQSSEKLDVAGHAHLVPGRAGRDDRGLRRLPARDPGHDGAGGGHGLGLRLHHAHRRLREHPQHRLRLDPVRPGHRLRHLLRRPLPATAGQHGFDQPGAGGDGRHRGAGHSDRGADLGHRLLRRLADRVSRRGATGNDCRRRRPALLAGRGDGPAGDDPADRRRRREGEPARPAESAFLAGAAVRLSAADVAGARSP